jgi:hypothetical protein
MPASLVRGRRLDIDQGAHMLSRKMDSARLQLAGTIAAAALLAACGGGGGTDEPAAEQAAAEPSAVESPATTGDAPAPGGVVASASALLSATRESAQAASGCPDPTYAAPKVAAWDMTSDTGAERQALLARFGMAIVNLPPDSARTNAFVSGVRAISPTTAIAQYLPFPDLRSNGTSTSYSYALGTEASAAGWWLHKADGTQVSFTSGTTWAVNMTGWAAPNAAGQRYPQFKAAFDHRVFFQDTPLDYAFTANTFARPRVDADWRGDGTNQLRTDPTVQAAMRAGYAAYWAQLRALEPSVKIMAGLDNANDLSSPEFKDQLEGAFLDGMIGKSWSLEAQSWDAAMERYRTVRANTRADKDVVFVTYGASPTDYAMLRYGLASALMDDGMFLFIPASGSQVPAWYDEYAAPLGAAVDAPPMAPTHNGVYLRRFENGLALVNPSRTESATIDVGAGYQRLAGTQDPAVNSGAVQSVVTLGPREGLLMVRVPVPCVPKVHATPRVAALDYSRNTTAAQQDLLAKYKFVILSITKGMGGAKLEALAAGIKQRKPDVQIAQYTILNEVMCNPRTVDDPYEVWAEVTRNNWWLRDATTGARVQWTKEYRNCDVNFSRWSAPNDRGETYDQFKWAHDNRVWFSKAPSVDYLFIDNFWHKTRNDADWMHTGTNLKAGSPEANAIYRQAMADYVANVRAVSPQLKVMGNINHDLNFTEYDGLLDGAFYEGLIGKSWSPESWAGWDAAMNLYRGALKRTRVAGNVFLNTFADPTDYRTIRYGLASALLEDGYFLHIPATGTMKPNWVDDYAAPIGDAAEPPPVAPAQNGIWMRRYENGLVLVNPSKTATATIDVGPGYKRISGPQDPTVNNGQAESTVTLGPRQGLLMTRQ